MRPSARIDDCRVQVNRKGTEVKKRTTVYVGIDVHKKYCQAALMNDHGHVLKQVRFDNTSKGASTILDLDTQKNKLRFSSKLSPSTTPETKANLLHRENMQNLSEYAISVRDLPNAKRNLTVLNSPFCLRPTAWRV